jgi:hypothetical protein
MTPVSSRYKTEPVKKCLWHGESWCGIWALTNQYETMSFRGDSTEGENVGGRKESVALQRAVLREEPWREKK